MNLFDLTNGNYSVNRTISYPDYPESQIVLEVRVRAENNEEWVTDIAINGTYNGPTDVVAITDYQIIWTSDGKSIFETGSANLELSSGEYIQQTWTSTIVPEHGIDKFPSSGELIKVSMSPFQLDGNHMSYEWEGTVEAQRK